MKRLRKYNIYDWLIIVLLSSLAAGGLGAGFQLVRVLAIVFFPFMFAKNGTIRYLNGYKTFFIFLVVYSALSFLWTPNVSEGMKHFIYIVVHFILFFEIIFFSKYSKNAERSILTGWFIAVVITLIIAFWELTTDNHLPTAFQESDLMLVVDGLALHRKFAAVTFGNLNGYVTFLCFALPFLFYRTVTSLGNKKMSLLNVFVVICCIFCCTANGSRGGLLSCAIMVVIFLIYLPKNRTTRLVRWGTVIALLVAIPLLEDYFSVLSAKAGSGIFEDESRMYIYTTYVRMFLDTMGMGTGIGGLLTMASSYRVITPHNLFLEILCEFGIIIFIFFIRFLVKLFLRFTKNKDRYVKMLGYIAFFSLPFASIINSGYVFSAYIYCSFASLIVLLDYGRIKSVN